MKKLISLVLILAALFAMACPAYAVIEVSSPFPFACGISSDTQVGQYVYLGHYEQDNNCSNGTERIEWLVLEIRNGCALLISRYCLDAASFNSTQCAVTWATSDLRYWLNNSFYYSAFSKDERASICNVSVSTGASAYGNRSGGPDTTDKVFCLSINEANYYFNADSARRASLTAYAATRTSYNWWWLRSPGGENDAAKAIVNGNGQVTTGGNWVNNNDAVRPCIWVELP